jgi:hypothetical protein
VREKVVEGERGKRAKERERESERVKKESVIERKERKSSNPFKM